MTKKLPEFPKSPLPGTGRGTIRRMVEGQVQSITTPKGQEDSPVPLPHASHGPPPHSGEDFHPSPSGEGKGRGLSALRKPICPTPTPWCLSDQSGGLVPPRLKGRGLISQHAPQQGYFGG
jgi:hypothetical protein